MRIEPALAIEADRVRYDSSSALVTDEPGIGRIVFHLLGAPAPLPPPIDSEARAHHRDPRYLQLPRASPELETLAAYARDRVRGAATDVERVRRIVEHFRSEFDYSLEPTRARGLTGLVEFLERREGFCATFASASVLMLRSLGLPARAVGGFLATEFDDESGRYVVRGRHGHAWIEVHFDGLGWVRFDPTPSSADVNAFLAAGGRDAFLSWGRSLFEGASSLAMAESDAPSVGELLRSVARAPRAWLDGVRGGGSVALAATALVALLVLVAIVRRVRRALEGRGTREQRVVVRYEERFLRALARRGHVCKPSRTLRELADAALARDGEGAGPVALVVDLLYRARFAGIGLAGDETRQVELALAEIERVPEAR
jgi:hypothetical protein